MYAPPQVRLAVSLAVALSLSGIASGQAYHDSVVIILDGSGSMSGKLGGSNERKIEVAKRALKKVLGQVPDSTHVGLLVFNRQFGRQRWAIPLGPKDEKPMEVIISSIRSGGGTPLGEYMKIGADRLLEERKKQFGYGTYRLLIVTDGEAGDKRLVEKYTPDIVRKGIVVDVIGVDMRNDHTLAKKVHSYRRANDPEALSRALAEVFAEVSGAGDSSTTLDDFQILEGLSQEVASAMLSALTTPSNAPIGVDESTRASSPKRTAQPPQSPSRPRTPTADEDGGSSFFPFAIVIGIVVVIVLTRRRKRRR